MAPETGTIAAPPEKKIISKMSVKGLGCNPRAASAKDKNDTTPVVLCAIYGIADGTKSGEDNKGAVYTALTGRFEGVNLQATPPESFQSGKLFLPGGIQEVIEGALLEMPDGGSVQFALELRAVRAENPIGYSYQAVALVPPKSNDALSVLRDAAMRSVPQIAAPAPVPAIDAAPAAVETQEPAPAAEPAKPATGKRK